jgi:uncharacterized membrane protein YhiD involved in acid resistance
LVIPEWLTEAVHEGTHVRTEVLVVRLAAAFVMGLLAAGVYRLTIRSRNGSVASFLATLVLLSVVIALVTMVIGDNVARAFSLVGALAIVRFRTVVEDTRDTAFVMYAVVVGMAAGAGYILAPLLATPLVLMAAWLFRPRVTVVEQKDGRLILRLAAVRPPDEQVRLALEKHLGGGRLTGLATARGGAALDVTYAVALPPPEKAVALLAELSRIEGVQGVELKEA